LTDGAFVAIWYSIGGSDNATTVKARAFDAAGRALGDQFPLLGALEPPAVISRGSTLVYLTTDSIVTADLNGVIQSSVPFAPYGRRATNLIFNSGGDLATVWDSLDPASIQFQALQSDGGFSPIYTLASDGPLGSYPRDPTVTSLLDGNFFVSWWSEDLGYVLGVTVSAFGPPAVPSSLIPEDAPPVLLPPTICTAAGGSSPVVAWVSSGVPIQFRYLSDTGEPASPPICTKLLAQSGAQPALSCIDTQRIAVAGLTTSDRDGIASPNITVRVFADAKPTGHVLIPVTNPGFFPPAVLTTSDDSLQLAWADCDGEAKDCDLYQQALKIETASECPGDCDDDGNVTISDLMTGVNVLLGDLQYAACPALFAETSTCDVSVADLVRAVGAALRGCQ
jgi:hypothetical protein